MKVSEHQLGKLSFTATSCRQPQNIPEMGAWTTLRILKGTYLHLIWMNCRNTPLETVPGHLVTLYLPPLYESTFWQMFKVQDQGATTGNELLHRAPFVCRGPLLLLNWTPVQRNRFSKEEEFVEALLIWCNPLILNKSWTSSSAAGKFFCLVEINLKAKRVFLCTLDKFPGNTFLNFFIFL